MKMYIMFSNEAAKYHTFVYLAKSLTRPESLLIVSFSFLDLDFLLDFANRQANQCPSKYNLCECTSK